jgi:hypothetical protein
MRSVNEAVSEAIADELFGSETAGRPVYTLADDSALKRVAERGGLKGNAVRTIAEVVRSTLAIDDLGVSPFRWQAEAAVLHRRQPLETPPALPLLVVLTLAAEQMQADPEMAAHNYYSRMHSLLRVPHERMHRVEQDYRRHADELWGSLNSWLEAWEGERGVPTAYAVGGHAFIGLPMSQAVVRQHDRAALHELFALDGMTPGLRLAPGDMESAMDPYATRTPSPLSSNLRRLWRIPAARDRIVDAACLELETWDGSGPSSMGAVHPLTTTRLLAFLRTFPRKSIQFNIMLPHGSNGANVARFQSESGETSVPTIVGPGGSTRLAGVESISGGSLIGEVLSGELGADEDRHFGRRPRRVVPLRWDDLQGAFVEVERIALVDDTLVLAHDDARLRVEAHLGAHARPGWRELPRLSGVPDGWIVYQHVQIVSAPATTATHLDLLPLIPRARTSLALRGGFVLPGLLRKWSSLEPPEIVALAADASSVSVRIYVGTWIDNDNLAIQFDVDDNLAVVALAGHELKDGEYLVAMFTDGAPQPASTALLRLRSGDSPQYSVDEVDIRLVYSPDSAVIWPLSGGPADWSTYVNGPRLVGALASDSVIPIEMPEFVRSERSRKVEGASRLSVGTPMAENSCLPTGMHRFQLPPVGPDHPRTRTIEGECTTCGLVKRFAATPWAARKREGLASKHDRVVTIPPVVESDEPDFQVAFDALNHVGHGTYATFERIAAQVEGSGLFADSFLRRQEVVGHIDVARDDWLQVTEWAVNSATLVPVDGGHWMLTGSRSRGLLDQLHNILDGAADITESIDAELARVDVSSDAEALETRADALARIGVTLLKASPALMIARGLPRLSDLIVGLKQIVVPGHHTVERWDTVSASWQSADALTTVGAYRLKDFRSLYVVRSTEDVEAGTVRIGNAQLVKHVANMWAGDPLIGYHSRSGSVVAPLGADLPGLYGRALSVCSGRAPREIVDHRIIQYPSVPRVVADTLFAQLSQ